MLPLILLTLHGGHVADAADDSVPVAFSPAHEGQLASDLCKHLDAAKIQYMVILNRSACTFLVQRCSVRAALMQILRLPGATLSPTRMRICYSSPVLRVLQEDWKQNQQGWRTVRNYDALTRMALLEKEGRRTYWYVTSFKSEQVDTIDLLSRQTQGAFRVFAKDNVRQGVVDPVARQRIRRGALKRELEGQASTDAAVMFARSMARGVPARPLLHLKPSQTCFRDVVILGKSLVLAQLEFVDIATHTVINCDVAYERDSWLPIGYWLKTQGNNNERSEFFAWRAATESTTASVTQFLGGSR